MVFCSYSRKKIWVTLGDFHEFNISFNEYPRLI